VAAQAVLGRVRDAILPINRACRHLNLVAIGGVRTSMLHMILVIAGFILIGVACTGFWQGLKLKPNDNIPAAHKGSRWRT
jgi:uncharacterized membrane protein YciS (DUF1049 family)